MLCAVEVVIFSFRRRANEQMVLLLIMLLPGHRSRIAKYHELTNNGNWRAEDTIYHSQLLRVAQLLLTTLMLAEYLLIIEQLVGRG